MQAVGGIAFFTQRRQQTNLSKSAKKTLVTRTVLTTKTESQQKLALADDARKAGCVVMFCVNNTVN